MASKPDKSGTENFLKFSDHGTPEKMKKEAERLGETPEVKAKCLQEMKDLIKDSGLSCITTDEFLLRFLRMKKFNVQESFERLKLYVKQRVDSHQVLLDLRPEILEKCLRMNLIGFLPYRDAEERGIAFFTTGGWNANLCSEEEFLAIGFVVANYAAEQECSQLGGGGVIVDNASISLVNLPFLLSYLPIKAAFGFRSLPVRYKAVHCINENFLLKYILPIVYPFIPGKIKQRIQFHGKTRAKLFEQIPPCILPEEYGGTLGPLSNDHITDIMLDFLEKMKDDQRYFVKGTPAEDY